MASLSPGDLKAVAEVAAKIGVPSDWLLALIAFETAGTFNPKIKNPLSSARGLIQFMDATARTLGYADSYELVSANPTFAGQLRGPVLQYFAKQGPFPTKQSFYMTVFYPKYRAVPPATLFPLSVRNVNPGIDTVQSYVDKVDKKKSLLASALGALRSLSASLTSSSGKDKA